MYLNITAVPGAMEMVTDDERAARNKFWDGVLTEKKRIRPSISEMPPKLLGEILAERMRSRSKSPSDEL
jgi:hypothetical protein